MSLVEQCPPEILRSFISCLSGPDLASVSQVSRDWQYIAQPLLYREPYIDTRDQVPSSLYLFLRTLLSTGGEALAGHVRSLSLRWSDFESEPPAEPESDLVLFTDAASRHGLGDPFASDGAQVALLMHLLPCLRTLRVHPCEDSDEFDDLLDSHHATKSTASLPLAFQSLREFSWHSGDSDSGVGSTMLLALMRLPCIRLIDVHIVDEIESPFPGSRNATTILPESAVTNLDFSYGDISGPSLTRILRLPRALTHFSYRAISTNNFTFAELDTAMQPLKLTLCQLDLNLFPSQVINPCSSWTTLGSLREWPALRRVRMSLVLLVGLELSHSLAGLLPAGLRTLQVLRDPYWPFENVVDEVVAMLEQKEAMLPLLVKLGVPIDWKPSEAVVERLRAACPGTGVQLVEDYVPYSRMSEFAD